MFVRQAARRKMFAVAFSGSICDRENANAKSLIQFAEPIQLRHHVGELGRDGRQFSRPSLDLTQSQLDFQFLVCPIHIDLNEKDASQSSQA
jgi:hypothetical protein